MCRSLKRRVATTQQNTTQRAHKGKVVTQSREAGREVGREVGREADEDGREAARFSFSLKLQLEVSASASASAEDEAARALLRTVAQENNALIKSVHETRDPCEARDRMKRERTKRNEIDERERD